ncbi:MAG: sulfatase [Gemmataceae bacterium]
MLRHLFICILLSLTTAPLWGADAPRRPNIIVLMTDDQRWDCLGCMGHPHLKTPHIDRLARGGVTFDNAFVTTAICCVSRANFYTGMYSGRHGVGDFSTPFTPEILAQTFPAVLKKAGYRTGCLGKWGIGGPAPVEVFDTYQATGGQGTFFEAVDGEKVHNSEVLARRTEAFLRAGKPDQPFCLLVLYKSPHDPFLPDPVDGDLFRDVTFPIPKTYNDDHFKALPDFIRASEGRSRLMKRHPTPAAYQEFVRQYLRCLAGVDRSVGKIMAVLDELKLTDDTVVVFTSDHGFFLGEHGLSGKWLMHEESIRIPFIVHYPRLPQKMHGQRLDQVTLSIDLAPTVLDYAGAAIPKQTDGVSLKPLLEGQPVEWREHFFYEHHFHYGGRIPRSEGIRDTTWKYIKYFDVDPPYEELYNLVNDPLEEKNLAQDPKHEKLLSVARTIYNLERKQYPPSALPKPAVQKP